MSLTRNFDAKVCACVCNVEEEGLIKVVFVELALLLVLRSSLVLPFHLTSCLVLGRSPAAGIVREYDCAKRECQMSSKRMTNRFKISRRSIQKSDRMWLLNDDCKLVTRPQQRDSARWNFGLQPPDQIWKDNDLRIANDHPKLITQMKESLHCCCSELIAVTHRRQVFVRV